MCGHHVTESFPQMYSRFAAQTSRSVNVWNFKVCFLALSHLILYNASLHKERDVTE